MIDLEYLTNNTIIVTNNSIKENILMYISKNLSLINIKVLTKEELLTEITFEYKKDTIQYMYYKYNLNIDVCKNILNNLMFINESNKYLWNIKIDLINKKKIIESKSIINDYNKIIIFDIDIDPFYETQIKNINKNITIEKLYSKHNEQNKTYLYKFDDIKDEILYLFDKIYELLVNGIDINKIRLVLPNDEYNTYIEHFSKLYKININLNTKTPLYNYGVVTKILSKYKEKKDLQEIVKNLEDNEITRKIINVINKYDRTQNIYDLLVYDFKHTYIKSNKKTNSIEVVNINDLVINEDDYLFILGFNQNLIPSIKKDDDYLQDKEKQQLGLLTSNEINKLTKEALKRIIKASKETYLSYKLKTPFNNYIKSGLLDELSLIELSYKHNYEISPSEQLDRYLYSTLIDDLFKYNKTNENLDLLMSNVNNEYGKYDNNFTYINKDKINKLIKEELKLSYTSINTYYECAFKYYLKYLLKIKENSSNVNALFIGNLFHYVLSEVFKKEKSLDDLIEEFVKNENKELSNKDKIYLKKYKYELELLIEELNSNQKRSQFKDEFYEKEINIDKSKNIKVTITGKIDKILTFSDNTTTYVIVIDYKTGNLKVDYDNIIHGLNMQLFIYAYLLEKSNLIKNSQIAGFYLQNIGHDLIKHIDNKTEEEIIKEEYKLYGYSKENIDIMEKFDNDLESLKNLKLKQDGTFTSNSLLFNEELLNKFINIVDEKIDESIENITNGNFKINPKELKEENISCKYCKYFDICYKKNNNLEALQDIDIEDYKIEGE